MKTSQKLWRTISAGMIAAVLAGTVALGGTASANPTDEPDLAPEGISSVDDGVQVAARRAWTAQELLAAVPYDVVEINPLVEVDGLPEASGAPEQTLLASDEEFGIEPGGLPGDVEPVDLQLIPETLLPTLTGENLLAEPQSADVELQAILGPQGYPGASTRHEVFTGRAHPNTYVVYPYTTQGKVFFRQAVRLDSQGRPVYGSFVCSASVMRNGAIMTAGHCLHAGRFGANGWSRNVVFVPAYKDGAAPLGQWTATRLRVFTSWYTSSDLGRDVGGAVLRRNAAGRNIVEYTGWLGISWNYPYNQHYNAFGYPARAPFNGQRMITCQGSLAYYDTAHTPATKAIGCDMTGGSSGGAWVMRFGGANWLNGVNSYRRVINGTPLSQEMFSPHFDTAVKTVIWDCVVSGTC